MLFRGNTASILATNPQGIIKFYSILENVSCSHLNLSVVGGITAYILNGRTSRKDHQTKLYDTTVSDSTIETKNTNIQRDLQPETFKNYTKLLLRNTLNGAILTVENGSEYYNNLSKYLSPAANHDLFELLNISFVSRKGGNFVDENKEVLYNIVDSCRDLIRSNVIEMESTERQSVLSKINSFTQTQYDDICKQFNYCRTIYAWTRLGKEITINVGRMPTKKLIEFYGDFYLFFLARLNVSGIMTPEQEELMKNKTLKLGLEPGYALRHLTHYATDIFDQNVTKYYNFTVHLDSIELDRYTYDEWDNLNEDLMVWGKALSNNLRYLFERMTLLTQIFIESWKPDFVAFIRGDMVEIFKPDNII